MVYMIVEKRKRDWLFWSNTDGWVDFHSADWWPTNNYNLPMCGEWIKLPRFVVPNNGLDNPE
jgi:hypothetical protein